MPQTSAQLIVLSNAVEGEDAAFNRWYDDMHLEDVLSVPGVVSAFRAPAMPVNDVEPRYRYLAIYEIENEDPTAVVVEIFRRFGSGEMRMTDTMAADFIATLYGPAGMRRFASTGEALDA